MNILVAFLIFVAVYATGAPSQSLASTNCRRGSEQQSRGQGRLAGRGQAHRSDGHSAKTFDRLSALIRASHGRPITVTVDRAGKNVTLGPRATRSARRALGLRLHSSCRAGLVSARKSARLAADDCWQVLTGTMQAFGGLFHKKERGQLTSTVGIVAGLAARRCGWASTTTCRSSASSACRSLC